MINTLLQAAVDAASKAVHRNPIMNPGGYLISVYHRLVDRYLKREQRMIFVEDSVLEHLANEANAVSFEEILHNRLLLRTVMDAMDPDTLQIFTWRLYGFSVNEIALELSVKPNCVSTRFTRGLKAVKRVLKIT